MTYPITLKESDTIKSLVKAGKYNWSSDDVTDENFPEKDVPGKREIHLIQFDQYLASEAIIAKLNEQGMRPATARELLALGAGHPNLQEDSPIVALGSIWQYRHGDRYVLVLGRPGSERELDLGWFGIDWDAHCRFAAVQVPDLSPEPHQPSDLGSSGPLTFDIPEILVNGVTYVRKEGQ